MQYRPKPTVLAASLLVLMPHSAFAQSAPGTPRGVIDGVVTDDRLHPIANASISILGWQTDSVATRDDGHFRVTGVPAGVFFLTIRRLEYRPLTATLRMEPGDTVRPSFTLLSATATLDPVIISDEAGSPALEEFRERRRQGAGQFMDSDEIHRLNMSATSGLIRTFRGITIAGNRAFAARTAPAFGCPLQFVVDRVVVPTPKNLDMELPPPTDIAGIEVYTGPASVPLQYATLGGSSNGGAFCGVVMVWTKR